MTPFLPTTLAKSRFSWESVGLLRKSVLHAWKPSPPKQTQEPCHVCNNSLVTIFEISCFFCGFSREHKKCLSLKSPGFTFQGRPRWANIWLPSLLRLSPPCVCPSPQAQPHPVWGPVLTEASERCRASGSQEAQAHPRPAPARPESPRVHQVMTLCQILPIAGFPQGMEAWLPGLLSPVSVLWGNGADPVFPGQGPGACFLIAQILRSLKPPPTARSQAAHGQPPLPHHAEATDGSEVLQLQCSPEHVGAC